MVQDGGHELVDTALTDVALGHDPVRGPEHQGAELDRVDAEVQHAPSAEGEVEEAVRRIERRPEAEVGLDQDRVADAALLEHPGEGLVRREEAGPDRLHQEQPTGAGGVDHLSTLCGVERERLLAQDVLARLEEEKGVVHVAGLGSRDVDDVDVRVGGEVLVAPVTMGDTEAVGELVGPFS